MKLQLHSIGGRWPGWVTNACDEYERRYPDWLGFSARHATMATRGKAVTLEQSMARDAEKQLKTIDDDWLVIGLERTGTAQNSEGLARWLEEQRHDNRKTAILIGGPEGLAPQCLQRANALWSLSSMVMAHPVVRVVMAEQIYRACTILAGSPYHRGESTNL